MKITTKGQVTIPQAVRDELGLMPHTEVTFSVEGGAAVIRPARGALTRGKRIAAHLRAHGAKRTMSSRQLLALLRDEPDELDTR